MRPKKLKPSFRLHVVERLCSEEKSQQNTGSFFQDVTFLKDLEKKPGHVQILCWALSQEKQ